MMNINSLMSEAYGEAVSSPDPSNQNGAVIYWPDEIIARSCNTFQKGFECDVDDRPKKLQRIEHAESFAIMKAAKIKGNLKGATLVCPWSCCIPCARMITGFGINQMIIHQDRMKLTNWRWETEIEEAHDILKANGVNIVSISGPIPGAPLILVNGRLWCPQTLEFKGIEESAENA
jgi:deoxycytidylate deaminase